LITLEGGEGAGKSSQAAQLGAHLRAIRRQVIISREPGGTELGERIRALTREPASLLAELFLFEAARAQLVAGVVRPALDGGAVVILDRYADSTLAYQGYGRGFDLQLLAELNRLASDGMKPDLTIVLDCPVETGLDRTRRRARGDVRRPDRFEGEEVDFHRKVRAGFLAIAKAEPGRVTVVDSARDLDAVSADIRRALDDLIRRAD